jgi:hypothetical protein
MKNTSSTDMVFITLNHDIREQTAYNLTGFMLNYIVQNQLPTPVTVGECLGDPSQNWYRDAGGTGIGNANSTLSGNGSTLTSRGLQLQHNEPLILQWLAFFVCLYCYIFCV